jgi:hypothetical protein
VTAYNKYKPSLDGSTSPTYNAAAAGDQINNALGGVLIIKNASGASITCTINTPGTLPNGDAYPDKAVTVTAAGERWIYLGPEYIDANYQANLSWSATASVTWACVSLT